jgi:hypothetical protein
MKFIPYKRYRLYTQLPLADAKQRLRENLDSPKKLFFSSYRGNDYDGEIEADEFTIFQLGPLRSPRWPDIRGRFSTAEGKTSIDAWVTLPKHGLRLAACAIGFMVILFIGTLWSNWTKSHSLKTTFLFAAVLFGSLFVVYAVTTLNILVAANQSKKFLARLLEAEER